MACVVASLVRWVVSQHVIWCEGEEAGRSREGEGGKSVGSTGPLSASSGGFRGNFQGLNCFLHAPHLLAGARQDADTVWP